MSNTTGLKRQDAPIESTWNRKAVYPTWQDWEAELNAALQELVETHGVELRRLPDEVLLALWRANEVVMQELIDKDPMAAKVYASFKSFYDGARAYHHISEQAYINARDVVLDSELEAP